MNKSFGPFANAILAACFIAIIASSHAAVIVVGNTADSGAGSLRAALAAAANGDTIDATALSGTITLTTGELLVNQNVSIVGPGPAFLALNGNAASRVFHVTNGVAVLLSGLTIANGSASGNFPTNGGGGIYNDHSTLTVSNCTINGNSATGGGGGIYNDHSTLTMVNCTINGNSAPGVFGGGLYNNAVNSSATVTLISSTVSSNSAFNGGGIFNNGESSGTGTVSVTTSTLSGNVAGNGGGVANDGTANGTAMLVVSGSTFSGNSASAGGGILNDGAGATVDIGDSILNTGGAVGVNLYNIIGPVNSHGYNLCSDSGAGFFTNATDQLNTDPLLGPLADNGGPTLTHALLWGSPAIDQGKSFGLTVDQRGQPRVLDFASIPNASGGDGSDVGACEFIPPPPLISITALTNAIQLQGAGLSNLSYTIQAATNLNPVTAWITLGTSAANSNGVFSFTDTNALAFPARFYRAVLP